MGLFKLIEKMFSKMNWFDVSLLKLTVFCATMFFMTAWPAFREFMLNIEWHWWLLLTLLFMAPFMKKMFS
jgi:hypothetical protein